jgi:hypothetical protein
VVEQRMDMSGWLRKQLEDASPDLLRRMVKDMAEALMSADADVRVPETRFGRLERVLAGSLGDDFMFLLAV